MHHKYKNKGLVVISVAIDLAIDKESRDSDKEEYDRALGFLKKQGATFTNFMLDESMKFCQEKFHFQGPPVYFVFNPEGKWTQFSGWEAPVDYDRMERLVAELLPKH